jgi:hypothetical protein
MMIFMVVNRVSEASLKTKDKHPLRLPPAEILDRCLQALLQAAVARALAYV